MDQHKLYRTIKLLAEEKLRTEDQLLAHILENVIANEEIPIKGGRIWKLEPAKWLISPDPSKQERWNRLRGISGLRIADYPAITAPREKGNDRRNETNKYLRQKGIKHYSATGFGEKLEWKSLMMYQYLLAINAEYIEARHGLHAEHSCHSVDIVAHEQAIRQKGKTPGSRS